MSFDRAAIAEEVRHWFFDVYFQHWVAVGAGRSADGPAFILRYWGTPMFVTHNNPPVANWVMTGEDIVASLMNQQKALKDAGFDHTEIPEARVFVYNPNGASVEVIFSRQTADDQELQRVVINFQAARMEGVWKVVGIHSCTTRAEADGGSIDAAWAAAGA